MELNDELVVEIKRLGINGEGIAFYKKMVIFVPGTIVGELVKVKLNKVLDNMCFADVVEIQRKSEFRTTYPCPYYEKCGACQVGHIDYKKSGDFKRDLVIECISKYTKLNPKTFEIKPTYLMDNPFGYRYKSSLPLRKFNDKPTFGLYEEGKNDIVYIDTCLVQNDKVNMINSKVLEFISELNITPYIEKYNRGEVKMVVTRVSHKTGEAQVTIITKDKTPKIFELAKKIMTIDGVVSVYESISDNDDQGTIFGKNIKKLEGKDTIIEGIGKYKYELLPNAFFQLNPVQTEKLYEFILKACKLSFKERVLDAYCGAGTIGIYLSKLAKEVIGIEVNKEAVENAINNAKSNKVKNATFYNGDVFELLPKLYEENVTFDVAVFDPPRTGLKRELCEFINDSNIKRIVYVSCNPSTLAKDLDILSKKYNINYIQPVDMFPRTSHVETVVLLTRK